ncbi:MAG: SDR family oxidoreductase [Methylobacteriaceae bacterium]|nr:SDR family oxidoreductase [Methylobacteriaceae bacterium]
MSNGEKVALVTGAGSGVGKHAAWHLMRAGFSVVFVGRRRDALEAAAAAEKTSGVRTLICPANVADPAAVAGVFQQVRATFGRLDVLFNNAGVNAPGVNLEDLADDQWRNVVDVNLSGVFYCTREAFRIMKAQTPRGGRIINNGSVSAHAPRPNSIAYTATKHAVTGLTKATALDGRIYDIACGQIDIGNADTEMAQRMKSGVPQANGEIAVEAMMDPADVGRAVAMMASLPLEANVQFMTIMATKMPFIGRG